MTPNEQTAVEAIKRCPFCGGEAVPSRTSLSSSHGVFCQNDDCCGRVSNHPSEKVAIEAWNLRAILEASPTVPVSVFDQVRAELERAVRKFPTWPTDPIHASKVLDEEVGELSKAVLQAVYEPEKNEPNAVKKEALQAAAMAIRFLVSLDRYEYKPSAQHKQGGNQ